MDKPKDTEYDLDRWWIFDPIWWIKMALTALVIILCIVA